MSQYATIDEFAVHGLPANATTDIDDGAIDSALQASSAIADGVLRGKGHVVPLTAWPLDLTIVVCKLTAFDIIFHHRGASPTNPAHAAIVLSREWAERHLEKIAAGKINLSESTPARTNTGVVGVYTLDDAEELRGW